MDPSELVERELLNCNVVVSETTKTPSGNETIIDRDTCQEYNAESRPMDTGKKRNKRRKRQNALPSHAIDDDHPKDALLICSPQKGNDPAANSKTSSETISSALEKKKKLKNKKRKLNSVASSDVNEECSPRNSSINGCLLKGDSLPLIGENACSMTNSEVTKHVIDHDLREDTRLKNSPQEGNVTATPGSEKRKKQRNKKRKRNILTSSDFNDECCPRNSSNNSSPLKGVSLPLIGENVHAITNSEVTKHVVDHDLTEDSLLRNNPLEGNENAANSKKVSGTISSQFILSKGPGKKKRRKKKRKHNPATNGSPLQADLLLLVGRNVCSMTNPEDILLRNSLQEGNEITDDSKTSSEARSSEVILNKDLEKTIKTRNKKKKHNVLTSSDVIDNCCPRASTNGSLLIGDSLSLVGEDVCSAINLEATKYDVEASLLMNFNEDEKQNQMCNILRSNDLNHVKLYSGDQQIIRSFGEAYVRSASDSSKCLEVSSVKKQRDLTDVNGLHDIVGDGHSAEGTGTICKVNSRDTLIKDPQIEELNVKGQPKMEDSITLSPHFGTVGCDAGVVAKNGDHSGKDVPALDLPIERLDQKNLVNLNDLCNTVGNEHSAENIFSRSATLSKVSSSDTMIENPQNEELNLNGQSKMEGNIPLLSYFGAVDDNTDQEREKGNHPTWLLQTPPERAVIGFSRKKLLILDVNGLLADIVSYLPDGYKPDTIVSRKAVFKRPFCDDFMRFCFERFNVGVWSSRTWRNLQWVVDCLMGKAKHNLLFCWDQSHCTKTGFSTVENREKPLVFKELKRLWEKHEPDLPWEKGDYNKSNTLLLDDSPYKALLNPPNTAIFPDTYCFANENDNSLGPGGELRVFLEGLALAQDVEEYVEQNRIGQRPIRETNLSWRYYLSVIAATTSKQIKDDASNPVACQE